MMLTGEETLGTGRPSGRSANIQWKLQPHEDICNKTSHMALNDIIKWIVWNNGNGLQQRYINYIFQELQHVYHNWVLIGIVIQIDVIDVFFSLTKFCCEHNKDEETSPSAYHICISLLAPMAPLVEHGWHRPCHDCHPHLRQCQRLLCHPSPPQYEILRSKHIFKVTFYYCLQVCVSENA